MKRLFVALMSLSLLVLISGLGHAGQDGAPTSQGLVVPKAVGAPHPEGNEFMRINHAKLLLEARNKTLRLGERNLDFSLKACVACHAVKGADGKPVGYEDSKYFCSVCHKYVAVKIDCFACHNSKPEEYILEQLLLGGKTTNADNLAQYIKSIDLPTGDPTGDPPLQDGAGQ